MPGYIAKQIQIIVISIIILISVFTGGTGTVTASGDPTRDAGLIVGDSDQSPSNPWGNRGDSSYVDLRSNKTDAKSRDDDRLDELGALSQSDPTGDVPSTSLYPPAELTKSERNAIDIKAIDLRTDTSTNEYAWLPFISKDKKFDHKLTVSYVGSGNPPNRYHQIWIDSDDDKGTGLNGPHIPPQIRGADYWIKGGDEGLLRWKNGDWEPIGLTPRNNVVKEIGNSRVTFRIDYDDRAGSQPFDPSDARVVYLSAIIYWDPHSHIVQLDTTDQDFDEIERTLHSGKDPPKSEYPRDFDETVDGFADSLKGNSGVESVETTTLHASELDAITIFKLWDGPVFNLAWTAGARARNILGLITGSPSSIDLASIADAAKSSNPVTSYIFGNTATETLDEVALVSNTLDRYGSVRVLFAHKDNSEVGVHMVVGKPNGEFELVKITETKFRELPAGVTREPPHEESPHGGDSSPVQPSVTLEGVPSSAEPDSMIELKAEFVLTGDGSASTPADGVHLRVQNGEIRSGAIGEFDEIRGYQENSASTSIAGSQIVELYLQNGIRQGSTFTSGDIIVVPEPGAREVSIEYRAWAFDEDDENALGETWIGRDPSDTPLNKHVIDESYSFLDYSVYTETIEISPERPTTQISDVSVAGHSAQLEYSGSDPDGGIRNFEYKIDNGSWHSTTETSLDLELKPGTYVIQVRTIDEVGRKGAVDNAVVRIGNETTTLTSQPTELNVGTLPEGATYQTTITLTNTGNNPARIAVSTDSGVTLTNVPNQIEASRSTEITVNLHADDYSGDPIIISYNGGRLVLPIGVTISRGEDTIEEQISLSDEDIDCGLISDVWGDEVAFCDEYGRIWQDGFNIASERYPGLVGASVQIEYRPGGPEEQSNPLEVYFNGEQIGELPSPSNNDHYVTESIPIDLDALQQGENTVALKTTHLSSYDVGSSDTEFSYTYLEPPELDFSYGHFPNEVEPGETFTVPVTIENHGGRTAKDVFVGLSDRDADVIEVIKWPSEYEGDQTVNIDPETSETKYFVFRLKKATQTSVAVAVGADNADTMDRSFRVKPPNDPPTLEDLGVSPNAAIASAEFDYMMQVSDSDGDTVEITLQVYVPSDDVWTSISKNQVGGNGQTNWKASPFGANDEDTDSKFRFKYNDNNGHSGTWGPFQGPTLNDDDTEAPEFSDWQYPTSVPTGDSITVTVDISDSQSNVVTATLDYNYPDGTRGSQPMHRTGGTWQATIPAASEIHEGGTIGFQVSAEDDDNSPEIAQSVTRNIRIQPTDNTPPTISNYQVTNPSGSILKVQFDSSERLASIEVEISDGTGNVVETLSGSDFTQSGLYTYTWSESKEVGTYTATLKTAKDTASNDGASGESGTVSIGTNHPPSADAGPDQSVHGGDAVVLDGSGSVDPDDSILKYSWIQTGGVKVNIRESATATPEFIAPGVDSTTSLSFELIVWDSDGATDTDTVEIIVSPTDRPTADFGYSPTSPTVSEEVTFDATVSSNPDGTISKYEWDFDGDGRMDATGRIATHTFDSEGSHIVSLRVTGGDGQTDTVSETVYVADRSGFITGTVSDSDGNPVADAEVVITNFLTQTRVTSLSTDSDGDFSVAVATGIYEIEIDKTGYTKNSTTLEVQSGETESIDLILEIDESNDEFEPNDEVDAAALISPGSHNGLRVVNGESDYFGVVLDEGMSIEASISFVHSDGDLDLVLLGPDEAVLDRSVSVSDDESVGAEEVSERGTYYVHVYGFAGASAPYDLSVHTSTPGDTAQGALSGLVTDSVDDPIPGATVEVVDDEGSVVVRTMTDDNGQYSIDGLQTGSYTARATKSGFRQGHTEVTIEEGRTTTANIVLISSSNRAPVADAGADNTVGEGVTVTLDGTASTDPDDDELTYSWEQTGGPSVSLEDAETVSPQFTAPAVDGATTLSFELTVSDGQAADTDTVRITVEEAAREVLSAPAVSTPNGTNATISFTLTNQRPNATAYVLDVELPTDWPVVEQSADGGVWSFDRSSWVWDTVGPGETVEPTVTVHVPEAADGTYQVVATAKAPDGVVAETTVDVTITDEQSIPDAIAGSDGVIDDFELLEAIEFWRTGEPVPNTGGQLIDDFQLLELIEHWRTGEPV